ncbi:MAG: divergent polysaccharide deacetylase family protein [Ghiorsea sp.]|nr:divergent polysaccharide deacetylase family protein [Ghiorsea sp.]
MVAILLWLGINIFKEVQRTQPASIKAQVEDVSTPTQIEDVSTPNIGKLIKPIIQSEDTFTLVFEDELPEPITQSDSMDTKPQQKRHKVALIIDDVGYDMKALQRLLALPFTITVSILPDSPYAKQAAQIAHQHGVTVMLHMPMQTTNPKYTQKMEAFYLHTGMGKPEFTQVFEDALSKVPYVAGINNHMGSALTADKKSMQWLMALSKKHDLFFIDSRTSSSSVGKDVAKTSQIPWNVRDIFLDHSVEAEALRHAWQSALKCAKRNDHCIMLAHPHPETLAFLENNILAEDYHRFINISDVLYKPETQ